MAPNDKSCSHGPKALQIRFEICVTICRQVQHGRNGGSRQSLHTPIHKILATNGPNEVKDEAEILHSVVANGRINVQQ